MHCIVGYIIPYAPFTRGVSLNASHLLWMEWRQALPNGIVGPSRRIGSVASGRSWKLSKCLNANAGVIQSDRLMQIPLHSQSHSCNTKKFMWLAAVTMKVASAQSFRHAPPSSVDADAPCECTVTMCSGSMHIMAKSVTIRAFHIHKMFTLYINAYGKN